jgi:uncharacterized protein YeaO (DUF488 family)
MIRVKRVYDKPEKEDGFRILVDRLWPRGLTKKEAKIDAWLKEIAPSNELRKWFSHDPSKWEEFKQRYRKELSLKEELIKKIRDEEKKHGTVTLLYGTSERRYNNAYALLDYLS